MGSGSSGKCNQSKIRQRGTLCSAEEDEAAQYFEVDPNATTGMLNLSDSVTVTWYLVRIF